MVRNVCLQLLIPKTIALSAHTGTDSFVQVSQKIVPQEQNGLETSVKQLKRDASQVCTGLEVLALSFHPNVLSSSSGMTSRTDVFPQIMFVQVELTSTDSHACHTVDARMVKFGAIVWFNVCALKTLFGIVSIAFLVLVECFSDHLGVTARWVLSLMEQPVAELHQMNVHRFHSVF